MATAKQLFELDDLLSEVVLLGTPRITKEADYAIGLPEKGKFREFPAVKRPRSTGFVIQKHDAERAGCFSAESPVLLANGTFTPISAISAGDMVQTRFGPRKVNNVWYNGDANTWLKVTTAHGTLYATPNHRFWLSGFGWCAIGEFYAALCNLPQNFHTEEVFEASHLLKSLCNQGWLDNSARTRHPRDKAQVPSFEGELGNQVAETLPTSLRQRLATGPVHGKSTLIRRNSQPGRLFANTGNQSFETRWNNYSKRAHSKVESQDFRIQQLELEGWRLQRPGRRGRFSSHLFRVENSSCSDHSRKTMLREVRVETSFGDPSRQAVVDRARIMLRPGQSSFVVQEVPCRSRQDFPRFSCGDIQIQRVSRPGASRYDLEVDEVHEYVVGGLVVHNSHYDLRIQIPGTDVGASWAVPRAQLPDPGKRVLAVRQGDHKVSYFDFAGTIPSGYGKGEVSIAHSGPAELIESRPDMVRFGMYGGHTPQEFLLKQTGSKKWILQNVTPTREQANLPSDTGARYRDVKMEHFDPHGEGVDHAKLDGAHTFAQFIGGKHPRVYSYRKAKRGNTGLIEHTHKIEHLWDGQKVPQDLGDTLLRGEVWGRHHDGTPMHPSRVAGLLNAGVWRSRDEQETHGPLIFSPFDIVRHKGKDVRDLPYDERWKLVKQVAKKMKLELPDTAETAKEKQRLWEKIKSGKHPQTVEGIVRWTSSGPVKLKVREDVDVPIEGFYEAQEATKYHGKAVGGILVKHKGVLSRVGTGFTDAQRRHMHQNPDLYKGMIARVEMHDVTQAGKLRGPSFMGFHPDKNDPARLEDVVHVGYSKIAELIDETNTARISG